MKNKLISLFLVISDLAVGAAAFLSANYINVITGGISYADKMNIGIFAAVLFFCCYIFDLYAAREDTRENTFISVCLAAIGCVFILTLGTAIFGDKAYSLKFAFLLLIAVWGMLAVWRMLMSFVLVKFRDKNSILILESDKVPSRMARKIKYSCNNLNEAWYYIIDESKVGEIDYIVENILPEYDIIFVSANLSEALQERVFEECILLKKTVNRLATPSNVSLIGGKINQFGDTPVIELGKVGLHKYQRFVKRAFDITCSVIGLIITSPIFLVLSVAIKLDSEGPIFYTQERYTINKKKFNVYKFRTMRVDAEKYGECLSKKDDPRVTRVGKIIRKLRLDELPQFLNILGGSMSVVGPRPERPIFADEYGELVKNYNLRYSMKAGLTGYAQIYGKYNTRVSDKILLDMIYAIRYSLWLDIKLVILTIKTMFIKESTAGVEEEADRILNSSEKEIERRKNHEHLRNKETAKI